MRIEGVRAGATREASLQVAAPSRGTVRRRGGRSARRAGTARRARREESPRACQRTCRDYTSKELTPTQAVALLPGLSRSVPALDVLHELPPSHSPISGRSAASAAEIGARGCGREHAVEVALDALVDHLGASLRLRREQSHLLGHSALKEPPNSCKDASHDPGNTVHDISLSTPTKRLPSYRLAAWSARCHAVRVRKDG